MKLFTDLIKLQFSFKDSNLNVMNVSM